MDPTELTNSEWSDIGRLLTYAWIMAALVVVSGVNAFIGHIFIPSLVTTFHLPLISHRVRPLFYSMAVVFFGLAVFALVKVIGLTDVLARFWDDYWI